jgi:steroid 3-oxidase
MVSNTTQAKKRMTKLIQMIIQEKRKKMIADGENMRGTHPRDMIDVLLGNDNDELTDELISDNMIDFMIPAEDSVPVLITLAVKYLSECPLALQQLEVCLCLAVTNSHFSLFFRKILTSLLRYTTRKT